jgi:hypothetical protein
MTTDDLIGLVLSIVGLHLLIGLVVFLIVLNHSRNKQAKAKQYKIYNGMNTEPTFTYPQYFTRWEWVNPWDVPPFPDPSKHPVKTHKPLPEPYPRFGLHWPDEEHEKE